MTQVLTAASTIQLLVLDVDGVLSNGQLIYSNGGEETKTFYTADGLGIKLLLESGVQVAIITGRTSAIVERRARELGIQHLVQGREDKLQALHALASQLQIEFAHIAYMGDDLPDLAAISQAGLGLTVANANPSVIQHADWCSQRDGGQGAVREACELILDAQGKLQDIVQRFLEGR